MRKMYVHKIYEVRIPDDKSKIYDFETASNPENAEIIRHSDENLAVYLSYQLEAGNFTDIVDVYDLTVTPRVPRTPR